MGEVEIRVVKVKLVQSIVRSHAVAEEIHELLYNCSALSAATSNAVVTLIFCNMNKVAIIK